jgi:hypothetical protein
MFQRDEQLEEVGDEFSSPDVETNEAKFSLECPECGTFNSVSQGIESFPKNLVLLQVT